MKEIHVSPANEDYIKSCATLYTDHNAWNLGNPAAMAIPTGIFTIVVSFDIPDNEMWLIDEDGKQVVPIVRSPKTVFLILDQIRIIDEPYEEWNEE